MKKRGVEALGLLVKQLREDRGLTQAELGERVNRSQRWVSALEGADIAMPRRELLHVLAVELHADVAELYVAGELARSLQEARAAIANSPVIRPDDPYAQARSELVAKMEKVVLDPEREGLLQDILDRMLFFDRKRMISGDGDGDGPSGSAVLSMARL